MLRHPEFNDRLFTFGGMLPGVGEKIFEHDMQQVPVPIPRDLFGDPIRDPSFRLGHLELFGYHLGHSAQVHSFPMEPVSHRFIEIQYSICALSKPRGFVEDFSGIALALLVVLAA